MKLEHPMADKSKDLRVGLAVKPKLRSHRFFGNFGVVRTINAMPANSPETMTVELLGFASVLFADELTNDWMTA